uniref:Uncharacterized protein n=1 Tax=Romanomermis culicivorax TaxID=13658 RepID=A0A915K517_ROMCU
MFLHFLRKADEGSSKTFGLMFDKRISKSAYRSSPRMNIKTTFSLGKKARNEHCSRNILTNSSFQFGQRCFDISRQRDI